MNKFPIESLFRVLGRCLPYRNVLFLVWMDRFRGVDTGEADLFMVALVIDHKGVPVHDPEDSVLGGRGKGR